jgi:CHAD domain-containing protein
VPDSFIERERKFDVDPAFEIPDLTSAVPPGSEARLSVQHLTSDYYDTGDQALRRAGITFRRRTGTDDVGWHLKLPHGDDREELHAALSDDPPAALTDLLLAVTGGAPMSVIASLTTERQVTRVIDPAGDHVADIDLDHVQATAHVDGRITVSSWTELEIELGSPSVSGEQLAALARLVRDADARPSRSSSKLARALSTATPRAKRPKKKDRPAPRAGEILLPYLEEQRRMLLIGDVALRRGDDSVVHKTRVATRRFRSALRVFAPFFDPARASRLDDDLRWYAEVLGAVRDGHVLEQRLDAAVQALPAELVLGPVQQRIDAHLDANRARDRARLQAELTGERYLGLVGEIASWLDGQPPFTAEAERSDKAAIRLARKADDTVTARMRAANKQGDVELLHRARKSAKRARYAAEALRPILGKQAVRDAKRYERLQNLLGEHQDSVVAAQLLRELGAIAGSTPGENGFTFGLLYQREQDRAATARRTARDLARRHGSA